jgi:hypothetical protein
MLRWWAKNTNTDQYNNGGVKYVTANGHVVHKNHNRGYNNYMKISTQHQTRAMRYNAAARTATNRAAAAQHKRRAAEERQLARDVQRLAAILLAERLTTKPKPKRKPSKKYERY